LEKTLPEQAPEANERVPKATWIAVVAVVFAVLFVLILQSGHGGHPQQHASPSPSASAATAPRLDAYRGLATWVDVYDARAWADPSAAVKDMKRHGVRTLFLQTAKSASGGTQFHPRAQAAFIRAAHAQHMRIVAWYLPRLADVPQDYDRIARAVKFRTPDGQHYDSFALDIESTAVSDETTRNLNLDALSRKIRSLVGPSYALGAIIPSPFALARKTGFWNEFPYESVARTFDVLLPMGYYTFHGRGAAEARAQTLADVRILRAQPGCALKPIHLIGGLAERSTTAEALAFARAVRATECIGGSLYGWAGTSPAEWRALRVVPR
jgi:hypothetical protein